MIEPEQEGGDEDDGPVHLRRWISWVPEKPVELEALGHEDRLCSLFQQVLEVPLVCICGQVVNRPGQNLFSSAAIYESLEHL